MMKTNNISCKSLRLLTGILLLTTLGVGLMGCDSEDKSTYDLNVSWNIGGLQVCRTVLPDTQFAQSELNFHKVVVKVFEDDTKTALEQTATVTCAEMGALITDLDRGSYYIEVDAWADYMGTDLPFYQGKTEVNVPKDGDEVSIPLIVGKGKIDVRWQFSSGWTCGNATVGEVANVRVTLNNGAPTVAGCGQGHILLEDLSTGVIYNVIAQALDASGNVLYSATHMPTVDSPDFQVLPGQTYAASVVFQ